MPSPPPLYEPMDAFDYRVRAIIRVRPEGRKSNNLRSVTFRGSSPEFIRRAGGVLRSVPSIPCTDGTVHCRVTTLAEVSGETTSMVVITVHRIPHPGRLTVRWIESGLRSEGSILWIAYPRSNKFCCFVLGKSGCTKAAAPLSGEGVFRQAGEFV